MSGRRFQNNVSQFIGWLLDPGICLGCEQHLGTGQYFCHSCWLRLQKVTNPCLLCGLKNPARNPVCAVCLYDPPRWQKIISPMIYEGLGRDLIKQLKYSQTTHLANSLTTALLEAFVNCKPKPEVLLPVPLHRQRFIERGFNQAYEIARVLSQHLGIRVDSRALQRIRATESQFGLSANQRQENILKAFAFDNRNNYKHVAVVDDIVTSGSTANEITKTLHRAGVENVEIWGLARVLK